jgi:hypothetical protein
VHALRAFVAVTPFVHAPHAFVLAQRVFVRLGAFVQLCCFNTT